VEKFPFEFTEYGWGEFEIVITIHFLDPSERPVELYHPLKLYPDGNTANPSTKEQVISEHYDEIVFNQPKEEFYHKLMMHSNGNRGAPGLSEGDEIKKINDAQKKIKREIQRFQDKLTTTEVELIQLRQEIIKLEAEPLC